MTPPDWKRTAYEIYLRSGLIAYLKDRRQEAIGWFEKAKPLEPPRNFVVVMGHIPTGIEKLIQIAKEGKELTPAEARQGDPTASWLLMLADLYHEAEQWQRSILLCTRVIEAKAGPAAPGAKTSPSGPPSKDISSKAIQPQDLSPKDIPPKNLQAIQPKDTPSKDIRPAGQTKSFAPTAAQRSWAYFRRGRNYYCLEKQNPEEAYSNYLAAASGWPKADWADDAIFLAANIQWNHYQNADTAAALYRRLLQTYPESNEVARAAYFIGVVYHWSGRLKEARQAYEEAMEKFPNSLFTNLIKSGLEELERKQKGGN